MTDHLEHPEFSEIKHFENRWALRIDGDGRNNEKALKSFSACAKGKIPCLNFPGQEKVRWEQLKMDPSDLCGTMSVKVHSGARYFVILFEDFIGMNFVFFFKRKSETLYSFAMFAAEMKNKGHGRIRTVPTYNGTEYWNTEFKQYLSILGIKNDTSASYTPEQNWFPINQTEIKFKRRASWPQKLILPRTSRRKK